MSDGDLETVLSQQAHFRFSEVSSRTEPRAASPAAPSLGPLTAFTGTFKGRGFNSIFRPSQTAASSDTERIPQDLASFVAAGTITQAILDDPNTVLRTHIADQTIVSTTVIQISTAPGTPLSGGGTDNIEFLLGDPAAAKPNAQATLMTATFWIETVQHVLPVPAAPHDGATLTVAAPDGAAGQPGPSFLLTPPPGAPGGRPITVTSTQIQYSQQVMLNFNGLLWPHVSVATLVPAAPVPVPPSAWAEPQS